MRWSWACPQGPQRPARVVHMGRRDGRTAFPQQPENSSRPVPEMNSKNIFFTVSFLPSTKSKGDEKPIQLGGQGETGSLRKRLQVVERAGTVGLGVGAWGGGAQLEATALGWSPGLGPGQGLRAGQALISGSWRFLRTFPLGPHRAEGGRPARGSQAGADLPGKQRAQKSQGPSSHALGFWTIFPVPPGLSLDPGSVCLS